VHNGIMGDFHISVSHHREIQTFPHHKHTLSNKVVDASCPTLAQVLDEIDDMIGQLS